MKKLTLAAMSAVCYLRLCRIWNWYCHAWSYRTGPFVPNGILIADGFSDYLTLINERDGGIGGEKIKMIECETAYNTEKGGVLRTTKGEGSLVYWPLSTGITYQLIPKVTADNIPLHTMGYGRHLLLMVKYSVTFSTFQEPIGMRHLLSQTYDGSRRWIFRRQENCPCASQCCLW